MRKNNSKKKHLFLVCTFLTSWQVCGQFPFVFFQRFPIYSPTLPKLCTQSWVLKGNISFKEEIFYKPSSRFLVSLKFKHHQPPNWTYDSSYLKRFQVFSKALIPQPCSAQWTTRSFPNLDFTLLSRLTPHPFPHIPVQPHKQSSRLFPNTTLRCTDFFWKAVRIPQSCSFYHDRWTPQASKLNPKGIYLFREPFLDLSHHLFCDPWHCRFLHKLVSCYSLSLFAGVTILTSSRLWTSGE